MRIGAIPDIKRKHLHKIPDYNLYQITVYALGQLLMRNLQRSGIMERSKLIEGQKHGQKRNSVARSHGFRKFVNTNFINARLNDTIRNMLLGHSTALDDVYYKPKPNDLLQEYLKAVDLLTIDDSQRLRRENEILKIKKSEIEQLKEQVEEYKIVQSEMYKFKQEMDLLKSQILSDTKETDMDNNDNKHKKKKY